MAPSDKDRPLTSGPGSAANNSDGNGVAGSGEPPTSAEAYGRWVEQMQRSRGRHAAITRNLYTWSNYKNWADKMRHNWDADGKG